MSSSPTVCVKVALFLSIMYAYQLVQISALMSVDLSVAWPMPPPVDEERTGLSYVIAGLYEFPYCKAAGKMDAASATARVQALFYECITVTTQSYFHTKR